MNWNRLFDTQDLNWWTIVSGIGLNFVLTSFLFLGATPLVSADAPEAVFVTVICLGAFAITLLTAYVCGRLADERFLTYAFYPLIGFLILTVPGVLASGVFGLLVIGMGILGAFNGANLAARRAFKRRQRYRVNKDSPSEGTRKERA